MLPVRRTHCSECGVSLEPAVVRFDTTCGSVSCRLGHQISRSVDAATSEVHQRLRREREAEEADFAAKEQALSEVRARDASADSGDVLLAPVPGLEEPLVPLHPERAQRFLEHLAAILDEAMAIPDEDSVDARPPEQAGFHGMAPTEAAPGDLESTACSLCRGSCCQRGGTQAFHDLESVRRVVRGRPGRSREELLGEFESYLPERSIAGSCVFHTETGCAQPRALRSATCNRYRCPSLRRLLILAESGSYDRAVVGSFVGERLREASSIGLGGTPQRRDTSGSDW